MYCTQMVEKCSMSGLYGGEKFIQIKDIDDFRNGKEVEEFMRMGESAYGFYAVNLQNGLFRFDSDGEVVKTI